jgi:hypothetical protein
MGGIILKNLLPLAILPQRNSPLISADRNPCEAFFNTVLRKRDQSHWRYRTNYDFVHHPSEHYQIFRSNKAIDPKTNEPPTRKSYRHLLLRIPNLKLKAGEKSHFTVGLHPETKDTQTWQYEPPSSNHEINQYVQVILQKELPTDLHPFICITDYALKPKDDEPVQPLCVKYELGNIEGVHPSQFILYDRFSDIDGNADRYKNEAPKGVTMYSENPGRSNSYLTESKSINAKKPIYKISKTFETHVHSGWHISGKPDLNLQENRFNMADKFLPGNGFRIRYQLPGNADKIVLEQFNIRALVQSYQDGGGDNWTEEVFSGSGARGFNPNKIIDDLPLSSYPYMLPYEVDNEPEWAAVEFEPKQFKFFDFYKLKTKINHDESFMEVLTELPDPTFAIDPFNLSSQVMPRISLSKSKSVGFFHDLNEKHGNMVDNNTPVGFASLFDVPNSPMLSVMQLRHANLCDYSHAPSYILGNSYATTQVSRYKTWGRMRAISKEVESTRFNIQHNELNDKLWNDALSTASPWKYEIAKMNLFFDGTGRGYGPVRDENAQIDHQNTTVDHSFYTNRALLDGFFMTGVKKKWDNSALALKENEMSKYFEHLMGDKDKVTVTYPPFRNTRLKLFFENGVARETRFSEKTSGSLVAEDNILRYQTMAADLLIEGSFNINSTSVDAWISQLSAMKGDGASETPFPRFVNQPTENSWNKLRRLSDDEVRLLAHCLVEQIKLRGPFLSYSDFVNRRIQGNSSNRLDSHFNEWNKNYPETRDSVLGLRGAVQAAIAEAEINQSQFQKYGLTGNSFTGEKGEWPNNPMIPFIPPVRYNNTLDLGIPLLISGLDPVKFESSKFGLHAISKQRLLQPKSLKHTKVSFNDPRPPEDLLPNQREDFNKKVVESVYGQGMVPIENKYQGNMIWKGDPISFKIGWDDYSSALEFGEAPENLLAVENVATAANKPGWLMQSDILSPLLPVTNSRSDTFTIRVMGEPKSANSNKKNSRAWIELTVQRIPDFIKKDLDAPHHRPHEPFEDRNFNGYWDNDPSFVEHWLDLNQNGMDKEGERTLDVAVPDLPGGGGGNKRFADGLYSDVKLNRDVEEEPDTTLSRMGINQRFGRKFKIIKFRWIKEQDV